MQRNDYLREIGLQAPSGIWQATAQCRPLAYAFNAELGTRIVAVNDHSDEPKVISGAYGSLHIMSNLFQQKQTAPRRVDVRSSAGGGAPASGGFVTALDIRKTLEPSYNSNIDLLIGTSTGEIKALSIAVQLATAPTTAHFQPPTGAFSFNADGTANTTRCVAVSFIPGTGGASFVSVHADGAVLQHLLPANYNNKTDNGTITSIAQGPPPTLLVAPGTPATAAAVSPDGSMIAVAGKHKHGTCRIYDTKSGSLLCGFKSRYGGFLCCAWSPDGRCVAAGGEDDLVAVYSLNDGAVVAHCQGHSSFVSAVAFDVVDGGGGSSEDSSSVTTYRVASVGQDCQLMLWELEVWGDRERRGAGAGGGKKQAIDLSSKRGRIAQSPPRAEMILLAPVAQNKVHHEPLSDVKFVASGLLVASFDGTVKCWARPIAATAETARGEQQALEE